MTWLGRRYRRDPRATRSYVRALERRIEDLERILGRGRYEGQTLEERTDVQDGNGSKTLWMVQTEERFLALAQEVDARIARLRIEVFGDDDEQEG